MRVYEPKRALGGAFFKRFMALAARTVTCICVKELAAVPVQDRNVRRFMGWLGRPEARESASY